MGLTCEGHLVDKVLAYAANAENKSVTVRPFYFEDYGGAQHCDYCTAPGRFAVSYYPKTTASTPPSTALKG